MSRPSPSRAGSTGAARDRRPSTHLVTVVIAAATMLALLLPACGGSEGRDEASPSTSTPATSSSKVGSAGPGAAAPSSPGCGRRADVRAVRGAPPGDVERRFRSGGTQRVYRLGVPPGYDPDRPTPLVMNLHGSGSNALQASLYGRVPEEGAKRGMITVAPEAIDGRWQLGAEGTDRDFLVALLDDLESRYCIDTDRVHLIGMSLGAWKAAVTGCTVPDTFASVALVTVEVHPDGCPPLPMVAFHGTADPTVPYGEGSGHEYPDSPNAGLPGTRDNIARWAQGNGCDPRPDVKRIGDDVERWSYRNCTADVVLYTVFEAGHTWPGAKIRVGPTTRTIDATEISFDWFEAHPRTG